MFTWLDALGIRSQVLTLREYAKPYSIALPRWVIFSLPQALWLFSGIVAFSCIWGKRDPKQAAVVNSILHHCPWV